MENTQFQEALAMFNHFLINWDIEPLDETEAQDWGLVGDETEYVIRSLAFDFRSEMKSERASERDDYRANYEEICDRLTDED
jgi:hypothetical protein